MSPYLHLTSPSTPYRQPLSLNVPNIQTTWSTVYYEYDRQNFVLTVGKSVVLDYSLSTSAKVDLSKCSCFVQTRLRHDQSRNCYLIGGLFPPAITITRLQIEPFLGVAAIDVDIPQMKTIMTGMFSGIMYAFMINNNG